MADMWSIARRMPFHTKGLESVSAIVSPVKLRGLSSYLGASAFLFVIRPSQAWGGKEVNGIFFSG